MKSKSKNMKQVRRMLKDKRGIDTILAALLMVVIVVVASVMVYAWSTGLLGALLVTPTVGKEALNMENSSFASNNTVVTVYIRNTGTASVSLVSYYVKDASGNQYSRVSWTGPSIAVNALGTTNVQINTSCGSCSNSGSTFSFAAGNSYTVIVVTSRNNQFSFTVVHP